MKSGFRIVFSLAMSSSSSFLSSKMQIAVALYRRDPISSDPRRREIYKHEAYHWGILIITPGCSYDAYDATDRNTIDPITFRQENPHGDWWFNIRPDVDPSSSGKFLGYIIIGTVPSAWARDDVRAFLEEVPLPKKNSNPQESCVTWVGDAIRKFRDAKCVDDFKVGKFLDWALMYADQRLWYPEETEQVVYYNKETEKQQKEGKKQGKGKK